MNSSARSSVSFNVDQLCNPAVTSPQVLPTSGFYSGTQRAVGDALSTLSGVCLKLKTSPTVVRIRSQLCAAFSLRAASTLPFLTPLEQSTLQTFVPFPPTGVCAAPKTGAAGFRDGHALAPPRAACGVGFVSTPFLFRGVA